MSRFAFGLRYFLFALGSALNTREHMIWSIDLIQDCPNLCRAVCAILITGHTLTCPNNRPASRPHLGWLLDCRRSNLIPS